VNSNSTKRGRGRPPVTGLTPKQKKTLRAVRDWIAQRGEAPTIQELAEALDVTPSTAYASVKQLLNKGYLRHEAGRRRGISIAHEPQEAFAERVDVPILGQVAAGPLSFAEENVIGHVGVDPYLARGGRCFGLKVRGDSMINAGIEEGDTLIVRQQPLAEDGDIVVAGLGDEATVKRLRYSPERIELQAENPNYPPIIISPDQMDEFRIIGRVVAHLRRQAF